jgi:hypothetical protein
VTTLSDASIGPSGRAWSVTRTNGLNSAASALRVWIVKMPTEREAGSDVMLGVAVALPGSAYPVIGRARIDVETRTVLSLEFQES